MTMETIWPVAVSFFPGNGENGKSGESCLRLHRRHPRKPAMSFTMAREINDNGDRSPLTGPPVRRHHNPRRLQGSSDFWRELVEHQRSRNPIRRVWLRFPTFLGGGPLRVEIHRSLMALSLRPGRNSVPLSRRLRHRSRHCFPIRPGSSTISFGQSFVPFSSTKPRSSRTFPQRSESYWGVFPGTARETAPNSGDRIRRSRELPYR
jgi:hypothetical protein